MRTVNIILVVLIIFILLSCNVEDIVTELGNVDITAKEKIGAVMLFIG